MAYAQPARTLNQVERDRRAQSARAERLREQANAARDEVALLDRRLVDSSRRRTEAEAAAADAEERLAALRLRMEAEGARYQHGRDAFESALIAAAFSARRVEHTASRAGIFARAAAPALHADMRKTARSLEEARTLDQQIAEEQQIILAAQTAIDEERTELASLLARRRAVQRTLVADATAAERRVRQLTAEARTLRELADRVQRASTTTRRTAPSTSGTGTIPAAWLAPASGSVTQAFGQRVAGGPAAQGATVRTRAGVQVVAPAAGEVAYSGEFRSYGQVLILNLDGGYAVVLTGLDVVRARVGERVQAGQAVGEMPNTTDAAPELYVEVRRNGQPVDPARWLSARGVQAAGAPRADSG
ncbi:lipoprotein NlpD [alpha proteobacterium U9-1i]|nr:lipoprotein NlpD [alpha proteobacterium U9-1i]